jgi:hypothetical protein
LRADPENIQMFGSYSSDGSEFVLPFDWVLDGPVLALNRAGSLIFAGGTFVKASKQSGGADVFLNGIAQLDTSTGVINDVGNGVSLQGMGQVMALHYTHFGQKEYLVVGGSFQYASDNTLLNNIGIYDFTGRLWKGLGATNVPGVNREVRTILSQGNSLYLGGSFDHDMEGNAFSRIVEYDLVDDKFVAFADDVNGDVNALAVDPVRQSLIVAGAFSHSLKGNVILSCVGEYNLNNTSWSPIDGGMDCFDEVFAVEITGNYTVFGGHFRSLKFRNETLAPLLQSHIAFYDRQARMWAAKQPHPVDAPVRALTSFQNDLIIGGDFEYSNWLPLNCLAKMNIEVLGHWEGFAVSNTQLSTVAALISNDNGMIYVGGEFVQGSIQESFLAHFSNIEGSSSAISSFQIAVNGVIHSVIAFDGSMFIGGAFTSVKGVGGYYGLARCDMALSSCSPVDCPFLSQSQGVEQMVKLGSGSNEVLYISLKYLSHQNCTASQAVASYTGEEWNLLDFMFTCQSHVWYILELDGEVAITGNLITCPGEPHGLAQWRNSQWQCLYPLSYFNSLVDESVGGTNLTHFDIRAAVAIGSTLYAAVRGETYDFDFLYQGVVKIELDLNASVLVASAGTDNFQDYFTHAAKSDDASTVAFTSTLRTICVGPTFGSQCQLMKGLLVLDVSDNSITLPLAHTVSNAKGRTVRFEVGSSTQLLVGIEQVFKGSAALAHVKQDGTVLQTAMGTGDIYSIESYSPSTPSPIPSVISDSSNSDHDRIIVFSPTQGVFATIQVFIILSCLCLPVILCLLIVVIALLPLIRLVLCRKLPQESYQAIEEDDLDIFSQHSLPRSEIVLTTCKENGSSGDMWNGSIRGTTILAYTFRADNVDKTRLQAAVQHESLQLMRLDHAHIQTCLGVCDNGPVPFLVFEAAEYRLSDHILQSRQPLPVERGLSYLWGIASGLNFVHFSCITHGNVRSHSVMINKKDQAILTDFQFASYSMACTQTRPVRWQPPEFVERGELTEKGDIFGFGVLVYEVFSGDVSPDYNAEDPTPRSDGRTMLHSMEELMEWCLAIRPSDRPAIHDIMTLLEKEKKQQQQQQQYYDPTSTGESLKSSLL